MRERLNIAFVCGLSDKKLAQKLAPLEHLPEVRAIDVYRRTPFTEGPKSRWVRLSGPGRRAALAGEGERALRLLARARGYDVLVGCFQVYHGIYAALAGALWRKPVVQLIISAVDWNDGRPAAAWAVSRAAACGVRGPLAKDQLRSRGYARPVEIIHNPLVLPSRVCGPAGRSRRILVVGDLADEKDYPWMLEVLSALAGLGVDFRVTLCGLVDAGFLRLVEAAGLSARMDFAGRCDSARLDALYGSSAALLLTSKSEGLPMVVVEAMSHGLPVVVTAVGELPWLVRDGLDGRVVPHGDTAAMAQALAGVLDDQDRGAALGENGEARIRALAAQEFTPQAIALAWRRLLAAL